MPKKSNRRLLAEQIATERGIKVESAMRYLQRAAAPEGKQRIKKPTFYGLTPGTKQKAQRAVARAKSRVVKAVFEPSEHRTGIQNADLYKKGTRGVFAIKGRFKISKEWEEREIRLYLSAKESWRVVTAPDAGAAFEALLASKDARRFLDPAMFQEIIYIRYDGEW